MIGDRPKQQKAERNREMAEMRKAGATYREIGEKYGIRPETVRQVLWRHGIIEKRQRGRF